MKIQCDVCDKDEASVYCTADEAALCAACDHRVHHANKLAGKHQRFTLHHPLPKQAPLCDICQDRRAFLFCLQDRAILCRECDIPIHKVNEHTQKHTRFLLTGVKLSSKSTLYSESTPSSAESASSTLTANNNSKNCANNSSDAVSNIKSKNKPVSAIIPPTVENPVEKNNFQLINGENLNGSSNPISGSSISEYLIEMLPGWHVEDFLDSSPSLSPYGFSKNGENDLLPLWDGDLESNMSGFPAEKAGLWVPQVAPVLHGQTQNQTLEMATNGLFREQSKEFVINNNIKSSRKVRSEDNSFAVPQISPLSSASKRSRNFW